MKERKPVSLGERWRREATRGIDDQRLAAALDVLPSIRKSMVRVRPGSVRAELEGSMGSIHEVAIHVRTLPQKEWPTVVHVLRRSRSIVEALEDGRVPRSFDRLIARVVGEPLFPDSRRITWACTCDLQDQPCHHVLALHELIARRLDQNPWELLLLRGADLHALLARVRQQAPEQEHLPLPFGAPEEPVLYPEAEDADLDSAMSSQQTAWLLGEVSPRLFDAALQALQRVETPPPAATE